MALKRQLMQEIAEWIDEHQLKQSRCCREVEHFCAHAFQDVVNQKTSKFTPDALVTMLMKLGKPAYVCRLIIAQCPGLRPDVSRSALAGFLAMGFLTSIRPAANRTGYARRRTGFPAAASGPK